MSNGNGFTEWLLIGGPWNGKKLRIKAGKSVILEADGKKYLYEGREFFLAGKYYRIGVTEEIPDREILNLIFETGLEPVRIIATPI
ncbi:hypothetical protein [Candidatus Ferrigenium straubiae]|jgi:hypothetical protein|uniref:hypothetical protein n=1 Tax=Candidatus Ferrigenium straubiae TaxID=2919506 RepID=UPI003F4AABF5